MRADVSLRMASLDQISPEIILKIAGVIGQKLKALGEFSRESYGGVRAVAEMLNRLDSASSREILEHIEQQDTNLVETIRHLMFVFEDLLLIDPLGLKEVLGKVDRKVLTIALKGTSEQLRNQILELHVAARRGHAARGHGGAGAGQDQGSRGGAAADHRGGAAAGERRRGQPEGRGRRAVCRLGCCCRDDPRDVEPLVWRQVPASTASRRPRSRRSQPRRRRDAARAQLQQQVRAAGRARPRGRRARGRSGRTRSARPRRCSR